MATVYRRDFAPPAATRWSSSAAAASKKPYDHYVRARKAFEWSHQCIFDENNDRSIPDAHLPHVDEQSVEEVESEDREFDEGVELDYDAEEERESPTADHLEARPQMRLRQEEPDLPTPPVAGQVPHLELKGRLTPSPPPRQLRTADRIVSFVDDGFGGAKAIELKKLRSRWVQTPAEWRDSEHPLRFTHGVLSKEHEHYRKPRQKHTAPFLTNAHPSDRDAAICSGKTFNVKSSGKPQVSAARRFKSTEGANALFTHVHRINNKHHDTIPSVIRQHSSRSSKQLLQTEYQRQFRTAGRLVDLET
uniref:Uncharacterized protein n=1 Tax=Plectus sambesii TaxID=2011161 RepID=A0A914VSV4_9BILA